MAEVDEEGPVLRRSGRRGRGPRLASPRRGRAQPPPRPARRPPGPRRLGRSIPPARRAGCSSRPSKLGARGPARRPGRGDRRAAGSAWRTARRSRPTSSSTPRAPAARLTPGLAIRPRKGHLVITDRHPGFVTHQLLELGYLKSAHGSDAASVAFNVQPRATGQLLIGSSRQYDVEDPAVDRLDDPPDDRPGPALHARPGQALRHPGLDRLPGRDPRLAADHRPPPRRPRGSTSPPATKAWASPPRWAPPSCSPTRSSGGSRRSRPRPIRRRGSWRPGSVIDCRSPMQRSRQGTLHSKSDRGSDARRTIPLTIDGHPSGSRRDLGRGGGDDGPAPGSGGR